MRLSVPAIAFVALVLQTAAALAHAALVGSEPADGAMLAEAPSRFVLTFNEPVSPLALRLIDDAGTATTLDFRIADISVVIDDPGELGGGSHALSWRVISADGHPVGGTVLFSVGAPSAGGVPGAQEIVDWPLRIAVWICRVAIYLGFFIGIGGLFFSSFIARDNAPTRGLQRAMIGLGLVAVSLSVGLQGLDALDLPISSFATPLVWQTAMGTSWGATAAIGFAALVAALGGNELRGRLQGVLALAAFLGVGVALAASGHAGSARPQLLTRPAVLVHVLAVTFWIGALVPLATQLRRKDATTALHRFSAVIPFAVLPLVIAGALLAIVQVREPAALLSTAYGRVLLVKLALVVALLLLAAVNCWRLTGRVEAGDGAAARRLRRSILVEVALSAAILCTVATWRFTPPPRALEAAASVPASVHIHTAKAMVDVTLTPGHVGPIVASIVALTGDFDPLDAMEVMLTLSNPALGIEPIRRQAKKQDDGTWRVDDLTVPVAGRWDMDIAVLVSEFELVRLDGKIDIRR
jgi:copper transport protein